MGMRPGLAIFLAVQLLVLLLAWQLLSGQKACQAGAPTSPQLLLRGQQHASTGANRTDGKIPAQVHAAAADEAEKGLQPQPHQKNEQPQQPERAEENMEQQEPLAKELDAGQQEQDANKQQQKVPVGSVTTNLSEWAATVAHAVAKADSTSDPAALKPQPGSDKATPAGGLAAAGEAADGSKPGSGRGDAGLAPAAQRVPAAGTHQVTTDLAEWAADPGRLTFQDPQSRCLLHPDGSVERPPGWDSNSTTPFLFDTASMPTRQASCSHCPKHETPLLCCGVCVFEDRRCDTFYPKQRRSDKSAELLMENGFDLRSFTPCELFQRIRGRTLWFMGDSQTWHYFYSAECFLRNFAPSLHRTPPLPWEENQKLITVTWPVKVPPLCLELALGTRVCAVRVDSASTLMASVLPQLHKLIPTFSNDIMVFNEGLHYGTPGVDGKPPSASQLVTELTAFAAWRQRYRAGLPSLVWMDTPVQHFTAFDGSYSGGEKPFRCQPLAAWAKGDPTVRAGGKRNMAVAHLIPRLADAHLKTWNASVPLWDTHKPGECTHWCSPSAYQLWLFLLNGVLRDSGLGGAVQLPDG